MWKSEHNSHGNFIFQHITSLLTTIQLRCYGENVMYNAMYMLNLKLSKMKTLVESYQYVKLFINRYYLID